MVSLVWDQVGKKTFEAGLDRGVLYLDDRTGVPWSGLQSIDESRSGDAPTPLYFDGIKYFESATPDDFSAVLSAITFPDEFLPYDGMGFVDRGLYLDGQQPERFHLSYRTAIGNDLSGVDYGYKIHLLYNLTAQPTNRSNRSLGGALTPESFKWTISGIPEYVLGFRPTVHAVIDSTKTPVYLMQQIESILYGSDSTNATIPPLADITAFIQNWELITITDNGDGTWTASGPDELVYMTDDTSFQIVGADVEYTDADTFIIKSN